MTRMIAKGEGGEEYLMFYLVVSMSLKNLLIIEYVKVDFLLQKYSREIYLTRSASKDYGLK